MGITKSSKPLSSAAHIPESGTRETIELKRQFPSGRLFIGTKCRTLLLACVKYCRAVSSIMCFVPSKSVGKISCKGAVNVSS